MAFISFASLVSESNRLYNFRDVGSTVPLIQGSRLYRCAFPTSPDALTQAAIYSKSIVDLRTSVEKSRLPGALGLTIYNRSVIPPKLKVALFLLTNASWTQKWYLLYDWMTTFSLSRAFRSALNRQGLFGTNKLLLRGAQNEICEALNTVLFELESNQSVLITCTAGKDRTGLIISLILGCVGVPQCDIVNDYVQSAEQIQSEAPEFYSYLSVRLANEGLDATEWIKSPSHVMQDTLGYLDTEYGGLLSYLDLIGFGKDKQLRLTKALTE
eukprot:CAMPEP_0182444842 /NCGR_PEP_ID=MMETSP1172-20130603/3164_1 /TAXON_ID=708627 /ORGANISM="Timspurckia oligopyrenoides, Strain CCMP3278" /LENGTH=269 /DNA_ID=CAMNT_0024640489 /DNA_START=323 /DNA_END=1132 /DNA_ORIENTATION=+